MPSSVYSSDEEDMGLGGMMPEPERPPSPEPTYATYDIPADLNPPVASSSKSVDIRLVGSHPLWGHHLWNAARTFSTYLLRYPEFTRGRRILELGAGGALPSIVSVIAGAEKVVVTDYPDQPLIDNMQHNVDINLSEEQRKSIVCTGHTWGKPVEPLLAELGAGKTFDVILLSDLVFNHSQHTALIKTCHSALSTEIPAQEDRTPCLLIFYTHHRPHLAAKDRKFLDTLSFYDPEASSDDEGETPKEDHMGGWAYEKVVEEWTGPMFENDPGDAQVRGTVWGWRCWRVGPGQPRGQVKR